MEFASNNDTQRGLKHSAIDCPATTLHIVGAAQIRFFFSE